METTTEQEDKMTKEARIESIYTDLKFADRMTPGRTPWQTLRKRAEDIANSEDEAK